MVWWRILRTLPAGAGDEKSSEYFTRAARLFRRTRVLTLQDASKELFVA